MAGKSKAWRNDPAILARLPEVERWDIEGKSAHWIGTQLGVAHTTVLDDLKRITELRREAVSGPEAETRRQRSVAVHRRVQVVAWDTISELPANARNKSELLNTVIRAEVEISKLEGTQAATKAEVQVANAERTPVDPAEVGEYLRALAVGGFLPGVPGSQAVLSTGANPAPIAVSLNE